MGKWLHISIISSLVLIILHLLILKQWCVFVWIHGWILWLWLLGPVEGVGVSARRELPRPPHGYTEVLNEWVLNACLTVRWFLVPIFLFFPIVWLVWGTRATDRPPETTPCRKSRSFIFGCRFNVITTITLHTLQSLRVAFICKIINTGFERNWDI